LTPDSVTHVALCNTCYKPRRDAEFVACLLHFAIIAFCEINSSFVSFSEGKLLEGGGLKMCPCPLSLLCPSFPVSLRPLVPATAVALFYEKEME